MVKGGDKNDLKKYIFYGTIAILIILSYLVIKTYIIPLISAFILAYLVRPIYLKIKPKVGKTFAALLCILLVTVVILLPLGAIIAGVTNQTTTYIGEGNLNVLLEKLSQNELFQNLNLDLDKLVDEVLNFGISLLGSALSYLPSILLTIIVVLFGMFAMLTNWEFLKKELQNYLPFKDKKKVAKDISEVTKNIVYGTILIALIEFIIAVIGFYLIGVKFFLLLSAILFFLAFIPGLGPMLVWLPMAIYYLATGDYATLIGVVIIGIILSHGVDLVIRSKILGSKTKINPFIMLVGILGGISVFGVFGFIIGPLILIYTIKILQEIIK